MGGSEGNSAAVGALRISVVVPTLDEAGNIRVLVERLVSSLGSRLGEVIFVDDSSDDTPEVIAALAAESTLPIQLIHRAPSERAGGLGGAVVAGLRAARHDWVCVMDADLQHPPEVISEMIARVTGNGIDLVVASRRVQDGDDAGLSRAREFGSKGATLLAKGMFPGKLSGVSDPLSGFFLVRRSAVPIDALEPDGFKILLEILIRSEDLSVGEVGFHFGDRNWGETKASAREAVRYLNALGRMRVRSTKPSEGYYYDIHGIVDVRSDVALRELAKFRAEPGEGRAAVDVRVGNAARVDDSPQVHYRELFRGLGFSVSISKARDTDVVVSPLVGASPHVLYTNVVEPILRWRLVEAGYALVHAACVAIDGRAHMITARTDTGKTTTTLKLLERGRYAFISDDHSLINRHGHVLSYPKPMTISNHTVDAVTSATLTRRQSLTLPIQSRLHSRSGRRAGFAIAKTRLPAATMNAVVQKLIPPPKYHVEQLVAGASWTPAAILGSLFVITRDADEKRELTEAEAIELILSNSEDAFGFPPYREIEPFLRKHSGRDLADDEREILSSAFVACPAWLIGSRTMAWADHIDAFIEEGRAAREEPPAGSVASDWDDTVIALTEAGAPLEMPGTPDREAGTAG